MSFVTGLTCSRCGEAHDHRGHAHVCGCGGPLLVEYDLEALRVRADRDALRGATMWRYADLLPADEPERAVTLGEGGTPLRPVPALGAAIGVADLWLMDEGVNPTGTFKARGASSGLTRARELGVADVSLPTAGNAGGAWAAYGAAAGIAVHVAMPRDAPEPNRVEVLAHGAELTLVDGTIADAGRLVASWVRERGWYDASTLREPYRIEGKKTLGLEIAERLSWRPAGAIVYPAGGGVGLIGIWRAIEQLRAIGWVEGAMPRLIAAQAAGCAPIVRAFEEGSEEVEPWEGAATIASGLRVPSPLGGPLTLRAIRETGGTAIAVADAEILDAARTFARVAGVLAAPEGAATLAGARRLRERGDLAPDERVVLINTGTGLKYPEVLALLG